MIISHSKPFYTPQSKIILDKLLERGEHNTGETREKFEEKISEFINSRYSFAVSSGSAALHLALLGLGIGKGDNVILPSFTCSAVLNSVLYVGANPILVDVDESSFNISNKTVSDALHRESIHSSDIKCAITVHNFGCPQDLTLWEYEIPIIEDCCTALGSKINSRFVGNFGIASVFSFMATKMLSTGQGGLVSTSNEEISDLIANYTQYDKNKVWSIGWNYLMSDINSGLGISQFEEFPNMLIRRNDISQEYRKLFNSLSIKYQISEKNTKANNYRFIIKVEQNFRKTVQKYHDSGISVSKPVYCPLHRHLNLEDRYFPVTTKLFNQALSIPIYPSLTEEEINYIIKITEQIFH